MPCHDFYTDSFIRHMLGQLKKRLIFEYCSSPDLYDPLDIDELLEDKSKEWYFKRFLINSYLDVDRAFTQLCNYLKWKKEVKLRYLRDQDFPLEFFGTGALFPYECDLKGNPSLYIRIRFVKRAPEILQTFKMFLIHQMNKVDSVSEGYGWTLIFDFTGANITNCDLELVNFLIKTLCEYFPCGVDYILTYEIPWYLNAVWRVIRSCIPDHSKDLVHCADKNSIKNFISSENLPDFMGGTCVRSFRDIPKGCLPTEQFGRQVLGLSCKQMTNLLNKFKPLLREVNG